MIDKKLLKEVDYMRELLRTCAEKGKVNFNAPDPEPAFEIWFKKSGLKKSEKKAALLGWYAALKEMGC